MSSHILGLYHKSRERGRKTCREPFKIEKLVKNGLKNIIQKNTFENYVTAEKWQTDIKNKVVDFTNQQKKWFYIGGQSGYGKTHLCTSICSKFLSDGKDVIYMLWLSYVKELKSTVNDYENHKNLIKNTEKQKFYILMIFSKPENIL